MKHRGATLILLLTITICNVSLGNLTNLNKLAIAATSILCAVVAAVAWASLTERRK